MNILFKRKRGIVCAGLMIVFGLFLGMPVRGDVSGDGVVLVPEDVHARVEAGILAGDYGAAEKAASGFIDAHPGEPAGYLFKASVLQYRFIDFETTRREDEFYGLLEKTMDLSRERLDGDSGSVWALYYLSAARCLYGARRSSTGNLLQGITSARSGVKYMGRVTETDSTFYDACFMTGSYRFWRSVALGKLRNLPFVDDERERGIAEVERAASRGRLNGPLSQTVLIEMLLAYDPARAAERAEKLTSEYPSCRLFAWQLGEAYKKRGMFEAAERIFTGIAESMREDKDDDGTGELRCWWKLADCAKTVGKTTECIYYCEKVVAFREMTSLSERNRERIRKARNILKELTGER